MSAEQLLGSVETSASGGNEARTVVADFEAGIGTLTRMQPGAVDTIIVVVEPTPRSLEVGRRAIALVAERELGEVVVVANRLRDDADREQVRKAFADAPVAVTIVEVPDDPAIIAADRDGRAPLDHAPDAPAVLALVDLATRLPQPA